MVAKLKMYEGVEIPSMGVGDIYRFLGIAFTTTAKVNFNPQQQLSNWLSDLKNTPLKVEQKILILRQYVFPRLMYGLRLMSLNTRTIKRVDAQIRKWVKAVLHLPSDTGNAFFYTPNNQGGLGIPFLYQVGPRMKLKLHSKLRSSEDAAVRSAILSASYSREWTWAKKVADVSTDDLGEMRSLFVAHDKKSLNTYRATQQGKCHAAVFKRNYPFHWLDGRGSLSGRDFIWATKLVSGNVPTFTRRHVDGGIPDQRCRRCKNGLESDTHLLQMCPHTKDLICKRHNIAVGMVAEEAENLGYRVELESWHDVQGKRYHPDLILTRGDKSYIVDLTVGIEDNGNRLENRFQEKMDKYADLAKYLKIKRGLQFVHTNAIVLGSRGGWPKKNYEVLKELGLPSNLDFKLCRAALKGSVTIVTTFFKVK